MDIPHYPDSRPPDLADRARFSAAFAADPPEISEFTFTNLYAWRKAYGLRVSFLGGFLVLRAHNQNKRGFFRPVGRGNLEEAVSRLSSERVPFIRIPAKNAPEFARASGFKASPDRDNYDYLYSCRELVELKGKRFDGKRNLIRKFKRQHAYKYMRLDGKTAGDCLDFADLWCGIKDCGGERDLAEEREAVREMCRNFSHFGLSGGAIIAGGRMCAAAIGQPLNRDTLVMHVLKAVPAMPGLYQVMLNEYLAREGRGYEYVNMEQDLGIEGLRKSKLSYQPLKLVEKFRLSP